jgi:hypothetical protein
MALLWEVTCIAGATTVELVARGTTSQAATAGLLAAERLHPELPKDAWLVVTVLRQDGRANVYVGWHWVDFCFGGKLLDEHWRETTAEWRERINRDSSRQSRSRSLKRT